MNLPSDVTLPELKLHLEFKDPNYPFKNSVETSRFFSDVNNYSDLFNDQNFIEKYTECKDSTFIIHHEKDGESFTKSLIKGYYPIKLLEPLFIEYYVQVGDGENIGIPDFSDSISFTDNIMPEPEHPGDYMKYFGDFLFSTVFLDSCEIYLKPWSHRNSNSEFEAIDDIDKNLYFDANEIMIGYDHIAAQIALSSGKDVYFLKFKELKDYLNIKDNDYIKYGFLLNIDSNKFIHIRYYINDIFVFHFKSKQTHSPLNTTNFFSLTQGKYYNGDKNFSTIIKDLKIYCHIDNDEIIRKNIQDGIAGSNWFNCDINVVEKKYIQDGAAGTNWFKSSIKVIDDPSLKTKEGVEDEINNQIALNPYINLNELQIFAKINDNNLYPVTFAIQDGKVHIKYTDFIAKKQLYIGSKRQFIHHQYIL